MSKKIVLSGYFGFDNLGDEAILYSMIEGMKGLEDLELVVLSANPQKTSEKFGVRAVNRMKMGEVFREIRTCDLFVSGGGSLLQDVTSSRSLTYYLTLLRLAKFLRKKVMIYSQGIGPVQDPKNRERLAKVFKNLDLINVRDKESYEELVEMGVKNPIKITADTVFMLDTPEAGRGRDLLKDFLGLEPLTADQGEGENRIRLGISIRPWKDLDDKIVNEIKKTIAGLRADRSQPVDIIFLPFHHPGDLEISRAVYEALEDQEGVYLLEKALDEREMLALMTQLDLVLSMRLHGLIFGLVAGAYPLGISYDPKIQSLLKEIGLEPAMEVEDLSSEELLGQLGLILEDIEERRLDTREMAALMKTRAEENIKLLRGLIE